jgi:hypothetical protein
MSQLSSVVVEVNAAINPRGVGWRSCTTGAEMRAWAGNATDREGGKREEGRKHRAIGNERKEQGYSVRASLRNQVCLIQCSLKLKEGLSEAVAGERDGPNHSVAYPGLACTLRGTSLLSSNS